MVSGTRKIHAAGLLVKSAALVVVVASLSLFTKAYASPAAEILGPSVGLDQLLNGGSITVGDKIFADFSISGFDAAGVQVIGIEENGNFGIRLQGGFAAFGNQTKDILFGFSVTVAPESDMWISDVHLDFNGVVTAGYGHASVVETATDPQGNQQLLPPLYVVNPPPVLSASADLLSPQKKIFVLKDVLLVAGGDTAPNKRLGTDAINAVSISQIDQTFSQIPEPGTVVLVAAGLVGVVLTGRRRK